MATIRPTREAFLKVLREHPNESEAQQYRLAQAQTFITEVYGDKPPGHDKRPRRTRKR